MTVLKSEGSVTSMKLGVHCSNELLAFLLGFKGLLCVVFDESLTQQPCAN